MTDSRQRIPVAVLGATGMVGQRFIELLQGHPWFELVALAASERRAGRTYAEVAQEIEANFAQVGMAVFSNAKNYRMEPDVPLLIPEVNADHAAALSEQRKRRGWSGSIVTNANCSATPLVMALKPLQQAFDVHKVMVTTLQAISGAGYPGLPSYDILDNAIPYIGGEEEKVESETRKMLGTWEEGEGFTDAPVVVSAQCNRVATREGHLECVSVELDRDASPEEIIAAWAGYRPEQIGRAHF